jgi:tetratricopeptide (TPR) repeat protein
MAQGVPRPEGLPPGPVRTLVHALHDLYRDAGMPSMRAISGAIRRRDDLPDTVSHETIGLMLRGGNLPGWTKLESVVRHLAGIAVHQPDVQAEVTRFHEMWLAAVADAAADDSLSSVPHTAEIPNQPVVLDEPATAVPRIVGEAPARNTRFVGRQHILRTIHEVLCTGAPLVALTGTGGVGKSQLAKEYLHRFRDHYDLVWWVPADHPSQLRDYLARLGTRLNLPGSEAMQHPPAQVLEALRSSELRWLLVFDNAGSPDSLPPLTDLGSGRVLLTSRHPDWAQHGSRLDIGVFDRVESVRLLQDRAPDISMAEANQLAERLGDFPLAVEQVAAWHQATEVSVASYLDNLDQQIQRILSDRRAAAENYPVTVSGFLNVAVAQLAEAAPAAAQLLEMFAWLGSSPLSLTVLRSGRLGAVTSPLREALRQAPMLNSAVRDLRRHGLVGVLEGDPVRVQVHRVFRWALRDWLGEKRLARGLSNVRAIFAAANPGEPDDSRFWGHYADVGPHVTAAAFATAEEFEVRGVALDQVRYLFRIGHYSESKSLARELIATATTNGPSETDHYFYVLVRHHLGNALRMLGEYEQARQATLDALEYLENHPDFGPQDEYVDVLDKNRAADLRIAGSYGNALTVDEAALERQRRRDVDDQDKIRVIRNNIAVNLRLLGRFGEAYEIDREIVRQWTDMRGAYDPRTLFARGNLAWDLFGLGRYADALAEVGALLPAYREVVGANHHGVLLAVRTEVMALRKLGKAAAALRLAEQNLRDLTTWFGPRHEYTLATGVSLVNARLAVGDLGVAAVEAPRLLGSCTDLFGADHPMTLAAAVGLASVLRALGDLRGAEQRDRSAAESLSRVLGADHRYALCATHNLAVDLAMAGHDAPSSSVAADALARSRSVRGDAHPDTLAGAINAGAVRGTPDDQALHAYEDVLGPTHPQVVAARNGEWITCDIEPPPA